MTPILLLAASPEPNRPSQNIAFTRTLIWGHHGIDTPKIVFGVKQICKTAIAARQRQGGYLIYRADNRHCFTGNLFCFKDDVQLGLVDCNR